MQPSIWDGPHCKGGVQGRWCLGLAEVLSRSVEVNGITFGQLKFLVVLPADCHHRLPLRRASAEAMPEKAAEKKGEKKVGNRDQENEEAKVEEKRRKATRRREKKTRRTVLGSSHAP